MINGSYILVTATIRAVIGKRVDLWIGKHSNVSVPVCFKMPGLPSRIYSLCVNVDEPFERFMFALLEDLS
jgi:hypothetical protein